MLSPHYPRSWPADTARKHGWCESSLTGVASADTIIILWINNYLRRSVRKETALQAGWVMVLSAPAALSRLVLPVQATGRRNCQLCTCSRLSAANREKHPSRMFTSWLATAAFADDSLTTVSPIYEIRSQFRYGVAAYLSVGGQNFFRMSRISLENR